jgi:hypothetical protein
LPWLITAGSGFDDWIYWHFFTIITSSNSPQSMTMWDSLHSWLDHECLLLHCDEWRIIAHTVDSLNGVCLTNHPHQWITAIL